VLPNSMNFNNPSHVIVPSQFARRRFVQGLAAGGVMLAAAPFARPARAEATHHGSAPVLSGTEFKLEIA